jgi:DNA-binding CsgD family transcriptional regulator
MPDPTTTDLIAADMANRCAALTEREREVLVLSSKGMPVKQMARLLDLSRWTVVDYRQRVHKKLAVSTAIEAAVIAAKAGLV